MKDAFQLVANGVSIIDCHSVIYGKIIYIEFPSRTEIDEFIAYATNPEIFPLQAIDTHYKYKVYAQKVQIKGE